MVEGCWVWNLNCWSKQQDTALGVATRCMLIGWGQNGAQFGPERGHEGNIHEVLQEDRSSSMYSNYYVLLSCISCILVSCCYSCTQGIWFVVLIGVYFRRLKINHDTYEFILESGTIVNNKSIYTLKIINLGKLFQILSRITERNKVSTEQLLKFSNTTIGKGSYLLTSW